MNAAQLKQPPADQSKSPDEFAGLALLATALSGRDLKVAAAEAGERAWTDGRVIYIGHSERMTDKRFHIAQVCVQSALLAAGSLDPAIVKKLRRKPELANRYLQLEVPRALQLLQDILPLMPRNVLDADSLPQTESAWMSLEIAQNTKAATALPEALGVIRPAALLAAAQREGSAAGSGQHVPRKPANQPLKELTDEADQGSDGSDDNTDDDATSPVGGGGGIGKLLQNLFQMVRNLKGGGSPGADAPTHWSRSGTRAGARAVQSSAQIDSNHSIESAFGEGRGFLYPEWNVHQAAYRLDWCTVQELEQTEESQSAVEWLEGVGLRKPLTRLSMGLDRVHRQNQGDDIDIDALIETQIDVACGGSPEESVYVESQRHRRDLSVMVLLDISGSVAQAGHGGLSVHEQQRKVSAALMTVLYEVGDRVALYAFHSQGREMVHMTPVKRFEENLDSRTMNRLYSLKPGAYSRLGAAIRHGATVLIDQGGTPRKLLLVLSDGLAYDHGYEPAYAAADVRQALTEARRDGVGSLCLSVGADTDTEALRRVFGSSAHALISDPNQLGRIVGPLFRTALQSTESQRSISQ